MNSKNKTIAANNACLLVIDVQLDFCPGGALAVEQGDLVDCHGVQGKEARERPG